MSNPSLPLNPEVTKFIDEQKHPLNGEIRLLRQVILEAHPGLKENIKWNGPNYSFENEDRITMKIQPPKQVQLVFHRGAKKQEQPAERLVKDGSGLLAWKENDRAIASFKTVAEIEQHKKALQKIVGDWIVAAGK